MDGFDPSMMNAMGGMGGMGGGMPGMPPNMSMMNIWKGAKGGGWSFMNI